MRTNRRNNGNKMILLLMNLLYEPSRICSNDRIHRRWERIKRKSNVRRVLKKFISIETKLTP